MTNINTSKMKCGNIALNSENKDADKEVFWTGFKKTSLYSKPHLWFKKGSSDKVVVYSIKSL